MSGISFIDTEPINKVRIYPAKSIFIQAYFKQKMANKGFFVINKAINPNYGISFKRGLKFVAVRKTNFQTKKCNLGVGKKNLQEKQF